MDSIRGAQEIALLLEERHGEMPAAPTRPTLVDSKAAPIFHWLGIEPPPAAAAEESVEMLQAERRGRLARYMPWRTRA